MLDIFKDFDLVDEMDKHLDIDEDILAECRPNKLPFIIRRSWQPIVVSTAFLIIFLIYSAIHHNLDLVFQNVFDFAFIVLFIALVAFVTKQLYYAILDAKTNYYVIATDGIHMLHYDKTLQYTCILYKDLKSVILKESFMGVGDIYIKEISDKAPAKFIDKFMYIKKGLIGIDEADKVFEVIKQMAVQDNDTIFFADANSDELEPGYFKEVKKYDKEINTKKDSSIISRRNNRREQ